jgi:hypothetical protein
MRFPLALAAFFAAFAYVAWIARRAFLARRANPGAPRR